MNAYADLADQDDLWAAFLARDASYNGHVFAGVLSTGIYCLFTCSARKPKRENVRFVETAQACRQLGLRACLKCRPDESLGGPPDWVRQLRQTVLADLDQRWTEADLKREGFSPSTVRRAFQRHYGKSFADFVRECRLRGAGRALRDKQGVIAAQLEAGFVSATGYREALKRAWGVKPKEVANMTTLFSHLISTPIGEMVAITDTAKLHLLEFTDRKNLDGQLRALLTEQCGVIEDRATDLHQKVCESLARYFAGEFSPPDLSFAEHGTPFQKQVWRALLSIPVGQTRSYAELATSIGSPKAVRALASANARNCLAILIPCHRVIGADGTMTGYAGGIWRKDWLLRHEGAIL
jgi:AraC family transcriptional regulator, regulatory protein of adaptative response / methylated-DNA-[protein]-cysteine methyltransferase